MIIDKIDRTCKSATITLTSHETNLLLAALHREIERRALTLTITEEDEMTLSELRAVSDILKDGNITRFLSYELKKRGGINDGI